MKKHLMLAVLIGAFLLPVLHAEEVITNTIKFSEPTKPGTLKIRIGRGDLRVTGADVSEITVKSKSHVIDRKPRKDGLRVLEAASSYSLNEAENVVTLDGISGAWNGTHSDYTLTVPRNTSVSLVISWGGNVSCTDLTGDLDIRNLNGQVHLDRLSGAACVETTNGEILADIPTLQPGKMYSFTSMNGEVRVRIPTETKANVRFRTQNGTILTDFEENVLATKTEMVPSKSTKSRPAKAGDRSRIAPEANDDGDLHQAVQDLVRAGADTARESVIVARDALRIASVELRAHTAAFDPDAPMAPLPPMTGGKVITGTLNGGGPEIQIATMNGDVTLRKLLAPETKGGVER